MRSELRIEATSLPAFPRTSPRLADVNVLCARRRVLMTISDAVPDDEIAYLLMRGSDDGEGHWDSGAREKKAWREKERKKKKG